VQVLGLLLVLESSLAAFAGSSASAAGTVGCSAIGDAEWMCAVDVLCERERIDDV